MVSNLRSAHRFAPTVSLVLISVLALSSCSDSDPSIVIVPPDDGESMEPIPPVPEPETDSDQTQFPDDVDADDRPGMIVTGLAGRNSLDIDTQWLINMGTFRLESRTPGTGDGFVNLVEYEDSILLSTHIEFYEPDLDVCEIDDPNAQTPIGEGDGGNSPPPHISGGQTVSINSPSGPWFLFNRTFDDNGEVDYSTNNGLPGALPEGATLSVPGDQFPAITAHPLFEPEAPVRLLPDASEPLSAISSYSWIPGPDSGYMEVAFQAYDSQGEFVDFVGRCQMRDDGSFNMPVSVRDFIAGSPLRIQARYARVYSRIDLMGDIVIRQRIIVAE